MPTVSTSTFDDDWKAMWPTHRTKGISRVLHLSHDQNVPTPAAWRWWESSLVSKNRCAEIWNYNPALDSRGFVRSSGRQFHSVLRCRLRLQMEEFNYASHRGYSWSPSKRNPEGRHFTSGVDGLQRTKKRLNLWEGNMSPEEDHVKRKIVSKHYFRWLC